MATRKNKQKKAETESLKETLSDTFESSPFFQFLSQNGRITLYFLAAIFLLVFVGQRLSTNKKYQTQKQFLEAEELISQLKQEHFNQLQEGQLEENKEEVILSLREIIQKHPELHAKYDGKLAQLLINLGKAEEATELADLAIDRSLSQTESLTPYHTFSKITLLIEKGNFEQALQESLNLKETLLKLHNEKQYQLLHAFNLLRIPTLYKQLKQKKEEDQAWSEFVQLASLNNTQPYLSLLNHFHDGKISLNDYIEARKRTNSLN